MIEETLKNAISANWPMFLIFTTVIVTIRIVYLIVHRDKFVLYKELFMLAFLIYAMLLFYVVTFQDVNYGTNNFVPFREIFRYSIGSAKFIKNIVGNILLFVPFGFFSSYYLKNKKMLTTLILTLITSSTIEIVQYYIGRVFDIDDIILNILGGIVGFLLYIGFDAIKNRLPKFFRSDAFLNFLIILIIVLIIVYSFNLNIFGIFS